MHYTAHPQTGRVTVAGARILESLAILQKKRPTSTVITMFCKISKIFIIDVTGSCPMP